MTQVEQRLDEYFGSLNSLTRRIWSDRDLVRREYGADRWDDLSPAEREAELEKFYLRPEVTEKYRGDMRETPEVFPKLRVNTGEKIVVDFENDDGWTWTDEHSGPFSWMTKSQQDLSLDDLDGLEDQMKKAQSRGKSHSPDRDVSVRNKPRPAEEGKTRGPSNAEAENTADEIFQKFGIAFSFGKDEDSFANSERVDDSNVQDADEVFSEPLEYENLNFVSDENDYTALRHGSVSPDEISAASDNNTSVSEVGSVERSFTARDKTSPKKDGRRHSSRQKSEAEVSLMDAVDAFGLDDSFSRGQVSPVFLEDPGESSTDVQDSTHYETSLYTRSEDPVTPTTDPTGSIAEEVICQQPTRTSNLPDLDSTATDFGDFSIKNLAADETDEGSQVKTGFDFLDNW